MKPRETATLNGVSMAQPDEPPPVMATVHTNTGLSPACSAQIQPLARIPDKTAEGGPNPGTRAPRVGPAQPLCSGHLGSEPLYVFETLSLK